MSIPYFGTVLAYSTDGGGNYTNIAGLRTITPPNGDTVDMGDDTELDASLMVREYFKGWEDPGTVGFTATFDDTVYAALVAVKRVLPNATKPKIQITFPLVTGEANAATFVSDAFLTSLPMPEGGTNSSDPITMSGTWKLSGAPTFTAGSA